MDDPFGTVVILEFLPCVRRWSVVFGQIVARVFPPRNHSCRLIKTRPWMARLTAPSNSDLKQLNLSIFERLTLSCTADLYESQNPIQVVASPRNLGRTSFGSFALIWLIGNDGDTPPGSAWINPASGLGGSCISPAVGWETSLIFFWHIPLRFFDLLWNFVDVTQW